MKYRQRKTYLLIAVTFYLLLALGSRSLPSPDQPHDVAIIAHRGGGTAQAENSLEGLEYAVGLGCDASEVDVQRTADGYYIIHHDKTFLRTAQVDRSPAEMTLSQIRALHIIGSDRKTLCSVPTLEETLDRARGRIPLFVELKGESADPQMADDVISMLGAREMLGQAVVIAFDYRLVDYMETKYPEVTTGYLYTVCPRAAASLNCDYLCVEENSVTDRVIQEIHMAGKRVLVWTVNARQSMTRFLAAGVDAIVTDEVELAMQTRSAMG